MPICLACYGNRLATLVESATELRFYSVERNMPVESGSSPVPQNGVLSMIDMLAGLGVEALICGGLSGCALAALRQSGVPVLPWIGGTAEEVAAAWAAGGAEAVNRLRLPGCLMGGCPHRHGPSGRHRNQSGQEPRPGAGPAPAKRAGKPK